MITMQLNRCHEIPRLLVTLTALVAVVFNATSGAAQSNDVRWLAEVTQVPANPPHEKIGLITPLLVNDRGEKLATREAWKHQRSTIRDAWLKYLGPMPERRPPVELEQLSRELDGGITRNLVRYECEPGLFVEGYLLLPPGSDKHHRRPGIVALHSTTTATIEEIAGATGRESRQIGLKLARRGFVVFCPRCFLWQNATSLNDAVRQHRERHPETLGMAKMLYDAMRAVDVLVSLPQVDPERIGAIGHSLGAKETLYLAAFDERVKAAVASEGGLGFRSTNWDAPWYLGEAIRDKLFPLNHHQLLALIAPRPFLVVAGDSGPGAADGERSWPLIKAAMPVWELYDQPVRLGMLNHREGHTISTETFNRMAKWLEVYLQ